jgi:hypothetical protein
MPNAKSLVEVATRLVRCPGFVERWRLSATPDKSEFFNSRGSNETLNKSSTNGDTFYILRRIVHGQALANYFKNGRIRLFKAYIGWSEMAPGNGNVVLTWCSKLLRLDKSVL